LHAASMISEFFCPRGLQTSSSRGDAVLAWVGLAVIVGHALFSAWIKYAINGWYTAFYDLLQESGKGLVVNGTATTSTTAAAAATLLESQQRVWSQLLAFFHIVLPAVVIQPAARWVRSHWALRWRMCLMRSYMDAWDPNVPPIEGASQRLHEDTQRFAKGVDSYLSVILNSVCTLAVFTPVLLSLGARVVAPYAALRVFGNGWMFTCACVSATLGLLVAMFAGRNLVGLEVANQRVEAELRRDAVVLETNPEIICTTRRDHMVLAPPPELTGQLTGGAPRALRIDDKADALEDPEGARALPPPAPHFSRLWQELVLNYSALFRSFLALNLWLDSFDQFMVVAPYLLVAPLLFAADPAERITLGTLVQTSNSFDKVFASLSILSENWGGINEWRSTVVRLRQFEAELYVTQASSTADGAMAYSALAGGAMASDAKRTTTLTPICRPA